MAVTTRKSKAGKSSKKARAAAARLAAVQAVYQQAESAQDAAAVIAEYIDCRLGMPVDGEEMVAPDELLFKKIVSGVADRKTDLEDIFTPFLKRGEDEAPKTLKTLDPLLAAVFLCGSYELLAHHEIDAPLVIAEYMNVTYAFYDQGEGKLVNAVLDKVAKAVRDSV